MKNILGTTKDLELFHKNGNKAYEFEPYSRGYGYEKTYDEKGKKLTFKEMFTVRYNEPTIYEYTYDEKGNLLTFKDSNGHYRIKGKDVTKEEYESFINGTPEYTMEELVNKLGHNFKIKK